MSTYEKLMLAIGVAELAFTIYHAFFGWKAQKKPYKHGFLKT